jgi:protein-arginine kinase activator protein McsA
MGERYARQGGEDRDPARRAAELKEQLRLAVETENFELAAELRDRLRVTE